MRSVCALDALIAIRAEFPDAKVVVMTTYEGDVHILRALRAGAQGYLLKNALHSELLHTIRAVHAGKRSLSPEVSFQVVATPRGLRVSWFSADTGHRLLPFEGPGPTPEGCEAPPRPGRHRSLGRHVLRRRSPTPGGSPVTRKGEQLCSFEVTRETDHRVASHGTWAIEAQHERTPPCGVREKSWCCWSFPQWHWRWTLGVPAGRLATPIQPHQSWP